MEDAADPVAAGRRCRVIFPLVAAPHYALSQPRPGDLTLSERRKPSY